MTEEKLRERWLRLADEAMRDSDEVIMPPSKLAAEMQKAITYRECVKDLADRNVDP